MPRFYWREGFESRVSAELVGDELERLRERMGGRLKPPDLVAAAARRSSPLHALFTWDDTEAAVKWRLHEARRVLQGILVEHPRPEQKPVMAYLSTKTEDDGRCYKEARVVMEDPELRARALAECKAMAAAWRRRYRNLEEVIAAVDAFEEALPR